MINFTISTDFKENSGKKETYFCYSPTANNNDKSLLEKLDAESK